MKIVESVSIVRMVIALDVLKERYLDRRVWMVLVSYAFLRLVYLKGKAKGNILISCRSRICTSTSGGFDCDESSNSDQRQTSVSKCKNEYNKPHSTNDPDRVLMADIFPTGYFGATNAFKLLTPEQIAGSTAVVIGCGPVGLCAIIAAMTFKPKRLFAIDSVDSRLELAKGLGAEPLNFVKDKEGMEKRIKDVTDGRGADVVIEVVGLSAALKTGFDLLRPWGIISSIGVHNGEVCSICATCRTTDAHIF